ncbi:30S ribosome-binding factor RbfA [Aerococcus sanguinicola]|uniref:Ribosome-binding factor A n=1 Tax=Aerococcus sanguinicola TaxID=119206 RepID=A0A0X8FCD9_9LACT|nr:MULTISPECIES: 30S ribosome-binding factor RbfA [Aerococcus]AMB94727.1 ribosome-binding factor A [Aerococcus sanguinicola]MDK6232705.1 30S ribosome-binding factor RbfA [Aerococcus sp. UMB10185]MDK6805346.1 30S ribosome-binding factor RbfA [Aerococcus sp. UMB7834]MDK6855005.1 30S ribosome-binding factor RbfA [Aerococcus sp. UMB7533]MDK7050940.1 30S ribosome-binding factor RbfA [Aerococcus sanguinicola]
MAKYRVERVAQEILREVNDILQKRVKDPRVENVTITDVDVTGDLQQATVYYSTLDKSESKREEVQKGLDKASGLIRSEVGKRLQIYKTPELSFKRDSSLEYGEHIDALLNKIKAEDK